MTKIAQKTAKRTTAHLQMEGIVSCDRLLSIRAQRQLPHVFHQIVHHTLTISLSWIYVDHEVHQVPNHPGENGRPEYL